MNKVKEKLIPISRNIIDKLNFGPERIITHGLRRKHINYGAGISEDRTIDPTIMGYSVLHLVDETVVTPVGEIENIIYFNIDKIMYNYIKIIPIDKIELIYDQLGDI